MNERDTPLIEEGLACLLFRMLNQAVTDLGARDPIVRREAVAWLLADDPRAPTGGRLFTSSWVLDALDGLTGGGVLPSRERFTAEIEERISRTERCAAA